MRQLMLLSPFTDVDNENQRLSHTVGRGWANIQSQVHFMPMSMLIMTVPLQPASTKWLELARHILAICHRASLCIHFFSLLANSGHRKEGLLLPDKKIDQLHPEGPGGREGQAEFTTCPRSICKVRWSAAPMACAEGGQRGTTAQHQPGKSSIPQPPQASTPPARYLLFTLSLENVQVYKK